MASITSSGAAPWFSSPYIGFPKTNHALRAAKSAIEKKKAESA